MKVNITLKELKEIAKAQGIKGYSAMNKEKLIAEIAKLEMQEKKLEDKENEKKQEDNIGSKEEEKTQDIGGDLTSESNDDSNSIEIIRENGSSYSINEGDIEVEGYLDILPDRYGFLRKELFKSTEDDVYVSYNQIRRFSLNTGDYVKAIARKTGKDKYVAAIYVLEINGIYPEDLLKKTDFETLIPCFPNERLKLETSHSHITTRIMDIIAPIGKGQRALIVSPPKSGKTTIIKEIANSIKKNDKNNEIDLNILLIDERPEEVTDIRDSVNANVVASTFDEQPNNHVKMAEMLLEQAKRKVEIGKDVVILLDSITRLARAYNIIIPSSGKILSGGFDPSALYKPKRFFGSARNIRGGGSLTIIATALVETGSRMDDIIYEEFKGTGNMELQLDRSLSENRIYPAIDIKRSGTRRDDLLLTEIEYETINKFRRYISKLSSQQSMEYIISLMKRTKNNEEFINVLKEEINKL